MIDAPQTAHPWRALGSPWVLLQGNGTQASKPAKPLAGGWTYSGDPTKLPDGLEVSAGGWAYRTAPFSHAQAWYATNPDGSLRALGNDPLAVARAIGAILDPSALVDDLLLGFRPDGRSAFAGVMPCGSAQAMEYSPAGARSVDPQEQPGLDHLGERVARAMNDGACIELTGGVDSRLLLSMGVNAGGKPTKSFTIGRDGDPDVTVARQISEALGMEHRTLAADIDRERLADDTRAFAAQSGFVCNAAAYGWLPTIFRTLAPWRTAQLSGVGGEIGEGFYYSGFDGIFQKLNSPRLWLRARVMVDGGRWADCFEPGMFKRRLHEVARQRPELNTREPWRVRTDGFYTHARIHGWAIPVIRASAGWYEPITPFLSGEYHTWARSLTGEQMHNRAAQRQLIERLSPQLAALPYAKQLASPAGGKLGRKLAKARKLAGRVLPRPTVQPDQWSRTAGLLMESLGGADSVVDRVRTLPGVRVDRIASVLVSDPATAAHAIGALVTMAMAIEAFDESGPSS